MKFLKTKNVILVSIFILIGFTSWFVYKYNQEKRQVDVSSRQAQELQKQVQDLSQKEQESFIAVPADNTKIYHNEEFGFEFQYPEDWIIQKNTFYSPFSKFNLVGAPINNDYLLYAPSSPFLINIVTTDFADRVIISRKNLDAITSNVTVSNIEGVKYEYKFENIPTISIDISTGKHRIILGAMKQYEGVFNQIISSFKFLK